MTVRPLRIGERRTSALAPNLWLVGVFGAHLGGGTQWTLSILPAGSSRRTTAHLATDLALVTLTMTISWSYGVASNQFGPRPVMSVLAVSI
jgi:hypothetical protein